MSTANEELKAMLEKAGKIINDLNQLTLDQEHHGSRLGKENDDLRAKLAASESGAAAMRAALEERTQFTLDMTDEGRDCEDPDDARDFWNGHRAAKAALATDCGKGWRSPEEAEKKETEAKHLKAALFQMQEVAKSTSEEAERLRKELEQAEAQLDSVECDCGVAAICRETDFAAAKASGEITQEGLDAAFARHFPERAGYVSIEECARRCREVAEEWSLRGTSQVTLTAIIDRVAKGAR